MTLVELVTVVAILAILAGISFASLSGMREGSRVRAAESQMENARMGASTCVFQGRELNDPAPMEFICGTNGLRWPELPGEWAYDSDFETDIVNRTFSFSASGDGTGVECDQDACERVE